MEFPFNLWKRISKNETIIDLCVALAWAILVGLPLFVLHMLILDYEHYVHGMSLQFSLEMSLGTMFPNHPINIALWLIAVFVAAFSVRRAFRRQRELLAMKGLLKRSQIEADTDELTGLLNRRAFNRHFKLSLDYARLESQPLTIAMIDVDGFKSLNDQCGHVAGDEALRSVAGFLTRFVRAQDAVARYGGDEFVILCPSLSREGAMGMVNRIKSSILTLGIELSIGAATYPSDGRSTRELIDLADLRMYGEKQEHHARHRAVVLEKQSGSIGNYTPKPEKQKEKMI